MSCSHAGTAQERCDFPLHRRHGSTPNAAAAAARLTTCRFFFDMLFHLITDMHRHYRLFETDCSHFKNDMRMEGKYEENQINHPLFSWRPVTESVT